MIRFFVIGVNSSRGLCETKKQQIWKNVFEIWKRRKLSLFGWESRQREGSRANIGLGTPLPWQGERKIRSDEFPLSLLGKVIVPSTEI